MQRGAAVRLDQLALPEARTCTCVARVQQLGRYLAAEQAPPSNFDCRSGPSVKLWPSVGVRQSLRASRAPTDPPWCGAAFGAHVALGEMPASATAVLGRRPQ